MANAGRIFCWWRANPAVWPDRGDVLLGRRTGKNGIAVAPGGERDECGVDEATGRSLCTANCMLKYVKGDREVVEFNSDQSGRVGSSFWMPGLRNKCKRIVD